MKNNNINSVPFLWESNKKGNAGMDITLYSPQAIMNLHIFMINENIFSYGMDSSTSGRRSSYKNVSYPKKL